MRMYYHYHGGNEASIVNLKVDNNYELFGRKEKLGADFKNRKQKNGMEIITIILSRIIRRILHYAGALHSHDELITNSGVFRGVIGPWSPSAKKKKFWPWKKKENIEFGPPLCKH